VTIPDLVAYIGAVVAPGLIVVALAFYREPKIRQRIALQEKGIDPRRVERVFDLSEPRVETVDQVRSAMSALGLQAVNVDQGGYVVRGRKGPTLRSWGQMLEVEVEAKPDGGSSVNVKSWPTTARAGTDWGAGSKLIQAFAQELERHATQALRPS
jgi:hypothetical protein